MADAVGPVFTGGFEEFVVNDVSGEQYTILYLPDRNNDLLQQQGKPPVFYWVPGSVRLARFGDTGDFKFRHTHFVGILDEETHVGVEGHSEVVGGLLSFTTTSRYPTAVLKQAEEQLLAKFRGDDDRYWGWRTQVAPMFRIAPIRSNNTVVTNLSPGADGTAPAEGIPTTTSVPTPRNNNSVAVRSVDPNQRVIHGRSGSVSNLDAWAWNLQGQGPGSVTGGENAYSGLIGNLPSELIWAGFQGGASPIVVAQNMMLPVWSQEIYLKITGSWERIFQHFSGHVNARSLWFSADIKAEFNQLRINGDIEVEMAIDGTLPGGEDMEKEINKRIDVVVKQFTEEAAKAIFDVPMPEVEPAEAPSGGILSRFFGGGGLALKMRRDEQSVNLTYKETRYFRYLQPNTISSSFAGFYNLLKQDPSAKDKYFTRLILGDLSRKVARIVKPVINWPNAAKNWIGEPVSFLSVEVGYPGPVGTTQWIPHVFQSTDTSDESNWRPVFARREEHEIANPPADWTPDKTYIRRRVHLTEPLGATDNPYAVVEVEKNVIDLDPEGGTLTTDNVIEVRADSVGKLEVGPIDIEATLQDNTQVIIVELLAEGKRHDGTERSSIKFKFNYSDYDKPRYWEIFTGQLDYVSRYKYRVHVVIKGTLFTRGMAWVGPWIDGQGNGPLMVQIPYPNDEGVQSRSMTSREVAMLNPSKSNGVTFSNQQEGTLPTPPSGETGTEVPTTPPYGEVEAEPVISIPSGAITPPPMGMPSNGRSKSRTVQGYGVTAPETVSIACEEAMPEDNQIVVKKAVKKASKSEKAYVPLATLEDGWVIG